MEKYKIFSYVDQLIAAYQEPVMVVDGLPFNHKQTLRTIEFYSNNKYESGNLDELGREKPFYNICNFRVTVAKTATDLDVKDIKFEPDSLKDAVATMLYNKELFKYLKEINFSKTLNEMGQTRPKYGGLLVKKYQDEDEGLCIEVVDWKNVEVDPCSIEDGVIIETHNMWPSEMIEKKDVWENVEEVIAESHRMNKGKLARIEVKEITGELPLECDPDVEITKENKHSYKKMCFYIACLGKKKYFLYKEDIKGEDKRYKYLPWERIPGRGLGRGIVEDGFEAQVWTNDAMISGKKAVDLSTKTLIKTDSQKISGNAITGVDTGHIFQMNRGDSLDTVNLGPSKLPEIEKVVALWDTQYNKTSSTYDANTGEAPTAGTPYSQTALLNQVANSPFEYQREVWGIFLNEILNDWIKPELRRRILKPHYLTAEFDEEELKIIDEAIGIRETNNMIFEHMMEKGVPNQEDVMGMDNAVQSELGKLKNKREVEIPEKFLDIEGKITANITGELKNKAAVLQSLDSVFKTVVSTFNPQTGQYAALQDPTLSKIFGQIVEMSGIPFSSAQLKASQAPQMQPPMQQPDPSAVQPQPVAA